jgi:colanic acid/amylovoran biosynthesis glycosyltransferase
LAQLVPSTPRRPGRLLLAPSSRVPRLLVVASTFPARRDEGTPGFVWDLAEQEARHFETIVLVPRVGGAPRRERAGSLEIRRFRYFPRRWQDLADGAILENLRARPLRWLQVSPFLVSEAIALRRLIAEFDPDVLHVHWVLPQGLVAAFAAPGRRWVLTAHGGDVYALAGWLATGLKRLALRRATAVTVPNQEMRERLLQLGANPNTTRIMPMGADMAAVRAARAERRGGRLLFVGRLAEKNGVAVLLRALASLELGDGWSLDLIGDGPLRPRLEAAAAGLGGRVRFLGTMDRAGVAAAMAGCDVFALPSVPAESGDQDGLPVVLLEAMAAGCAIVASSLPGIDAALVDGHTGLLVPPGDSAALAAALSKLLRDGELRAKLGGAAAEAVDDYSIQAVGDQYIDLLRSLAQASR